MNRELRAEIRRSENNFLTQQKRRGEELDINTHEEIGEKGVGDITGQCWDKDKCKTHPGEAIVIF